MTIVLDERPDASVAVYIDGDLQFDSRDEAIYHEMLALPALAVVQHRRQGSSVRALICGGGDGLVARELLKSPHIKHVDLVDYDPNMIELARTDWAEINNHALHDPRLQVHICDAVQFVDETARDHRDYDLIICDFTVPRDRDGARLHTIEWYSQLRRILSDHGALAVNAASPSQTPAAYWSIYNSLRTAKLNPRPYRIALPSFVEIGYGDDWGFFIAAPKAIRPREIQALAFAAPRTFLHNAEQLQRAFAFPSALAAKRSHAMPTSNGSQWLLQALFNPTWDDAAGHDWTSLEWIHDPADLPKPDRGTTLVPDVVRSVFNESNDEEAVFNRVVEVMPALRADQTRSMIREFIAQPSRFLDSIDLRGVVDALLRRASELPRRFVAELRLLRSQLRRSWRNPHSLLNRGLRIVSVIALVIILANVIHPDTAYGKGSSSSTGGDGVTSSQSLARTNSPYDVVAAPPSTVEGRGFGGSTYGRGYTVDEVGTYYPTRRYVYRRSYYGGNSYRSYNRSSANVEDPNEGDALYKLTPETDILANGEVVIALTEQSYLLLSDQVNTIVDGETGLPILFLKRDPALAWRTAKEIDRQRRGLQGSVNAKQEWMEWVSWVNFAPWRGDDEAELTNIKATSGVLDKALLSLGDIPAAAPPLATSPIPGGYQLFSGVWMSGEGSFIMLELPDDKRAFLTKNGWYSDPALTQQLSEPYPTDLVSKVLVPFLTKQTNDYNAILNRLNQDVSNVNTELSLLQRDKSEYTSIKNSSGSSEIVDYGTTEISVSEALKRTDDDIARNQQLLTFLQKQVADLPMQNETAKVMLAALK